MEISSEYEGNSGLAQAGIVGGISREWEAQQLWQIDKQRRMAQINDAAQMEALSEAIVNSVGPQLQPVVETLNMLAMAVAGLSLRLKTIEDTNTSPALTSGQLLPPDSQ